MNLDLPNVARVYDFLLGGTAYWSRDRSFGLRILHEFPEFRDIARAHRVFVNRVVRQLVRLGVRQFLDIGSGVLSTGNTHQIADEIAPCRVVYVDNEPVTAAQTELALDDDGDPRRHAVVDVDLRDPAAVWAGALATGVLDPQEPVAVLMFSVLQFFPPGLDDEASRAVAHYRELVPTGSYLGVSHVTDDGIPDAVTPKLAKLKQLCESWYHTAFHCRSRAAIRALLGDFELLAPGMVWVPQWHPEDHAGPLEAISFSTPNHSMVWAGVGRKR
ncbi:SAM-dependent methyltransferase [Actinophytocola sp.]|uniref:SAM-dependent methyltransferase n=1 Tax=Actinophytocola sp. TaxID=1872138 RepID=UPI002D810A22|nr:SAM-dependent methyltransferase [Actinophytocola sp.]HET9142192.1 SAM-dependent methyltransferase [Actinophytocola sp.]